MLKGIFQKIIPVSAAVLLAAAACLPALAADYPDYPYYPEYPDYPAYETTAAYDPWGVTETTGEPYTAEPETEPYETEPVTEAPEPVWTVAPEAYAYEEETESPRDEYAQLLEEAEEPTGLNSVKMDKSVSNKAYTTDNIAGIVSWICVAAGLLVVAVMLISTKLSGGRGGI